MTGKKPAGKKPSGRPSVYTKALATKLCNYIADGMSLRNVCKQPAMPSMTTVLRWLADDERAEFRLQYACAREAQADLLAEQILDIADEEATEVRGEEVVFDATAVARNRLRVDARKWLASKMAPKKYGDKLAVGGADDLPPIQTVTRIELVALGGDDSD